MAIKVTGIKEVEEQLRKLGSKDGTRVLRAAMLRAAKPIEDQAKANAGAIAEGSGALQMSIGKRFSVGEKGTFLGLDLPELGGKFKVEIAPFRKSRVAVALHNLFYHRKRKGIFYGHLIEFGHRVGTRQTGYLRKLGSSARRRFGDARGGGAAAGRVPAHPFLKPALDARGGQAVSVLADEIKKGIANLLRRRAKK